MILTEKIKEIEKEIERCNSKKDGDEHFSKENWDLRCQFCKGQLQVYKEWEQTKKEILEIINIFQDDSIYTGRVVKFEIKNRILGEENEK